LVKAAGA